MMVKWRRLTATKQNKLLVLKDFYTHVYTEDLPFHGYGDQIHFENEREIANEHLSTDCILFPCHVHVSERSYTL